ncbi:SDR family NAD(P)-dependent oxidoreductase [Actinobacillus delphinicola]|uniref:NADP-dependent dehydrogenase n=1 Tax=Actinobacillus delphinicola TaxID=51161 RepID=A0A448TU22_9PAST|nr:SDR family oxidoreductase [Actinobacillus delphinicola]VEJ09497.1 NADP-dependent dehydrogenase [Actinobacillus delphinicola]
MEQGYTLITGATSGIGLALAEKLARQQVKLILVARRFDALHAFQQKYPQCEIFQADLSQPNNPVQIYEFVKARGLVVERLINNAGVGLFGDFSETDLDKELDMIQLNISSLVTLTKLFLPDMQARNCGEIINVSSVASFMPGPKMSVYYATKAFVTSFTEALVYELRHTNIQVRLLAPGPTATQFEKASQLEDSKLFHRFKNQSADEVAQALLSSHKKIVIPGVLNKIAVFLARHLPQSWVATVVAKIQENK